MSHLTAKSTSPPLARVLTLRVAFLLLTVFTLTLTSISGFVVWQHAQEQEQEDSAARQMIDTRLQLLKKNWRQAGESITTGIEMQRIASQPDPMRWQLLRAWLVALGEDSSFDTVLVQDKNNQILFAHGHESEEVSVAPPAPGTDWHFSPRHNELHAVVRTTLWLGPETGDGQIIFLQTIQPSTLQLIGSDKRPVYLATIDDFGTGYSSLSQLHDMPVNEVKIDISFVRRIHTTQGMRVIQAIVQMASAMHLECVAEGIEDSATADILTNLGVNTLQGFFFGKPMPMEDFTIWLNIRDQDQPPIFLVS